ncbi:unnamed protein product [Closterium sp. NIES-54]
MPIPMTCLVAIYTAYHPAPLQVCWPLREKSAQPRVLPHRSLPVHLSPCPPLSIPVPPCPSLPLLAPLHPSLPLSTPLSPSCPSAPPPSYLVAEGLALSGIVAILFCGIVSPSFATSSAFRFIPSCHSFSMLLCSPVPTSPHFHLVLLCDFSPPQSLWHNPVAPYYT